MAADGSSSAGGGANPVTVCRVLTAHDLDAAVALVAGCPILTSGGSVEVCETFEVMQPPRRLGEVEIRRAGRPRCIKAPT